MSYSKDSIPSGHSEFGGGEGLLDSEHRKDRELLGHEFVWELYAVNPNVPGDAHAPSSLPGAGLEAERARAERAAAMALEQDPEITPIPPEWGQR